MRITKEFWAKTGLLSFPGGAAVPFWGFAPAPDGNPRLPGPVIEARTGDTVQVTLHNNLAEPVSMVFPGQDISPSPVKDDKGVFVSFARYAPPGGTATYIFRPRRPGTYLYESGTFPERQVQMGLYGVMVIRPLDYAPSTTATRTAYGMGTGTEFNVEKILVTGEIDSALHRKIASGLPYDMHDFNPDYFTISGRAYPDTLNPDDNSSQPYSAAINTVPGRRVLLRCANAGFLTHSLHIGGGHFRVVAGDGMLYKKSSLDTTYEKTSVTIGPGQTYDLILTADGVGETYLYDRELRCTVNSGQYPGGIMTSIRVGSR